MGIRDFNESDEAIKAWLTPEGIACQKFIIDNDLIGPTKIREILEQVCGSSDIVVAQEIIEALGAMVPGQYPHD